jgi:hypothetical protein
MFVTRKQLSRIIEISLSEVDKMAPPESGAGGPRSAPGTPSGFNPFPKARDPEHDIVLTPETKIILQIIDPTGILSWPDLGSASKDFVSRPSKKNKVLLYLALVGAFPMTGCLVRHNEVGK